MRAKSSNVNIGFSPLVYSFFNLSSLNSKSLESSSPLRKFFFFSLSSSQINLSNRWYLVLIVNIQIVIIFMTLVAFGCSLCHPQTRNVLSNLTLSAFTGIALSLDLSASLSSIETLARSFTRMWRAHELAKYLCRQDQHLPTSGPTTARRLTRPLPSSNDLWQHPTGSWPSRMPKALSSALASAFLHLWMST